MAKLHSASPREITSPFTREIISVLHSKACNNLYKFHLNCWLRHTMLLNAGKKLEEACAAPVPYLRDSRYIVSRPINQASSEKGTAAA